MTHKEKTIQDCLTNFQGKTFSNNEVVMEFLKSTFDFIWEDGYGHGLGCAKEVKKYNKYHDKITCHKEK